MVSRKSRRSKAPSQAPHTYRYLVSACLAGIDCTHKGGNKFDRRIAKIAASGLALVVCPEVLGGSAVPREACEISGGSGSDVLDGKARVRTVSGKDVTRNLLRGARMAARLARRSNIKKAILKSKSPSCGSGRIYDGTFSGSLRRGDGVTTALLRRGGIKVRAERGSYAI